jgi:hypothetical protein
MPRRTRYVMIGGRWSPIGKPGDPLIPPSGGTPPPPPPPPGGAGCLFGVSAHSAAEINALEPLAGPFSCSRTYSSGMCPSTFSLSPAADDIGKRASVYSFKPDMQQLASGALDVAIVAFVTSVPDSHVVFIEIQHELDVKLRQGTYPFTVMTLAQVNAAKRHGYALIKSVKKPHVYTNMILSGFSLTSGVTNGLPSQFWFGADGADREIDVVGWDMYESKDADFSQSGATKLGSAVAFAAGHGAGWGLAEIGAGNSEAVTNMPHAATWMTTMADYAAATGAGPHTSAAYFSQFNSTVGGVVATPGADSNLIAASKTFCTKYAKTYSTFVL